MELRWLTLDPVEFSLRQSRRSPLVVYRCRAAYPVKSGFFAMLHGALAQLEQHNNRGEALIIDWSDPELLYAGPPSQPNLWAAFFRQPAELLVGEDPVKRAVEAGEYTEVDNFVFTWFGGANRMPGVQETWCDITAELVVSGRAFYRQWVRPLDWLRLRVDELEQQLLPSHTRWLGVHVRLTDKIKQECVSGRFLTFESIAHSIECLSEQWGCTGFFFCSDNQSLKDWLRSHFASLADCQSGKLVMSEFPATLSADTEQPTHFDASLDKYKIAEDVVLETLLLARCFGLMRTYSSISVAAIYWSSDDYPQRLIFDISTDTKPVSK